MIDAYRYVQTETGGTARFLGMGGAFGALGGDISVLNVNPAGLAVYRSSEVVTTLSVNAAKANANWFGTTAEENKTKMEFNIMEAFEIMIHVKGRPVPNTIQIKVCVGEAMKLNVKNDTTTEDD